MAVKTAPQEQIARLLELPGVREDTRAVFSALLEACEDKTRLSEFVLESVSARLSTGAPQPVALTYCCGCRGMHSSAGTEAQLRSEALNDEGNRWLADFLLYTIGKRAGREERSITSSAMLSYTYEGNVSLDQGGSVGDSLKCIHPRFERPTVTSRGFTNPVFENASAGRVKDLQFVRLFPESGDHERLSRFRVLVNVFQSGFEAALSDENLDSPGNVLYMHSVLEDMVDEGGVRFTIVDAQVHAIPVWRESSSVAAPPESSLRRILQSTIKLGEDDVSERSGVDPDLVRLHAIILKTWLATGLSPRFLSEMRWIQSLPLSSRNASVLGVDMFSGVLQHRLAII